MGSSGNIDEYFEKMFIMYQYNDALILRKH